MDLPDYIVPPPANPGASSEVVWWDTKDGGQVSRSGLLGSFKSDQIVTLLVQKAGLGASDGDLITVNGNGSGDALPANLPHEIKVYFGGARTKVILRTTAAPTTWHADARLTSRPVL